jgi:hypothetical protein
MFAIELEQISLCTCTEPALQLLSMGLFPCAPSLPSLAVDLQMLDFARELFVNAAPNLTAWCETLEGFLSARQFKLTTRVGDLCISWIYLELKIGFRTACVGGLVAHYSGILHWWTAKTLQCVNIWTRYGDQF